VYSSKVQVGKLRPADFTTYFKCRALPAEVHNNDKECKESTQHSGSNPLANRILRHQISPNCQQFLAFIQSPAPFELVPKLGRPPSKWSRGFDLTFDQTIIMAQMVCEMRAVLS
jgi:hypothetical protein